MPAKRTIESKELLNPNFHAYSNAVVAGRLVFVAGQIAVNMMGELVGEGDIRAQTRQVFKNIEAILREVDAGLENLATMSVYLTDIRHLDEFCEVRRALFKKDFPASAAVQVSGLAHPKALLEVSAVAVLG